MIVKLIADFWARVRAKTPAVYLWLFRFASSLVVASGAVLALNWVPEELRVAMGWTAGISTFVAAWAKQKVYPEKQEA